MIEMDVELLGAALKALRAWWHVDNRYLAELARGEDVSPETEQAIAKASAELSSAATKLFQDNSTRNRSSA
jgi:hypothetical protein